MDEYFRSLFNKQPIETINGDCYFGSDNDGDNFDKNDAELWLNGIFKGRWKALLRPITI
jgi:hypothetical protein